MTRPPGSTVPDSGFVPPPYPQDRLERFVEAAAAVPGGMVDTSVGTPVDPMPEAARRALTDALDQASGYPPSIGTPRLREAAAGWIERRFGVAVSPAAVAACIGTKELVASLPHHLHLRRPDRDTVLYPAVSYPTYAMGALLARLRAVPVPVRAGWRLDLSAVDPDDANRAVVLWCNDPSNPTGVTATPAEMSAAVEWARAHDVPLASDECYAEFTFDDDGAPTQPVTALSSGSEGVLAVHSLSKRSNFAGLRAGFYAGDLELVQYLGEVRKHAGFMMPSPVQAAAVAALGDDAHVDEQRARYTRRRAVLLPAFERFGLVHDGGPSTFYLWLRASSGDEDAWSIAARLAKTGLVVAPGDLYGPDGARNVRVALSIDDDAVERTAARLDAAAG